MDCHRKFGHSVRDRHAEALEVEHSLVGIMGISTAYVFDAPSCVLVVGVISYDADIPVPVVSPDPMDVHNSSQSCHRDLLQSTSGWSIKW